VAFIAKFLWRGKIHLNNFGRKSFCQENSERVNWQAGHMIRIGLEMRKTKILCIQKGIKGKGMRHHASFTKYRLLGKERFRARDKGKKIATSSVGGVNVGMKGGEDMA